MGRTAWFEFDLEFSEDLGVLVKVWEGKGIWKLLKLPTMIGALDGILPVLRRISPIYYTSWRDRPSDGLT